MHIAAYIFDTPMISMCYIHSCMYPYTIYPMLTLSYSSYHTLYTHVLNTLHSNHITQIYLHTILILYYPVHPPSISSLGGEDFDQRVMQYFIKMLKKRDNVDISNDKRALQKLRKEVERVKRTLSSQHQGIV